MDKNFQIHTMRVHGVAKANSDFKIETPFSTSKPAVEDLSKTQIELNAAKVVQTNCSF